MAATGGRNGVRRGLGAILAATLLFGTALVAAGSLADSAAAADTPMLGPSRLTASQMAAWFRAKTSSPYRATVSVGKLASYYVAEGKAANVRGDIAFVQSVLETGWFRFPDGGYVRPGDNNFAGIGAYGDGSRLFRAPDARTGVRGQIQLLRRYADPNSRQGNIGYPPVSQLWADPSSYDIPGGTHGWSPTWEMMSGRWASAPNYADVVLGLYKQMLAFNGKSPTTGLGGEPFGSLDTVAREPGTIRIRGWAIDPDTAASIAVHVYVDGVGAAVLDANAKRPDVGAVYVSSGPAHGFDIRLPVTVGDHQVCAYAINVRDGTTNPLLGCKTADSTPVGYLDRATTTPAGTRVTGWTLGPDRTSALTVHLYVNGTFARAVRADHPRADITSAYPSWGVGHGYETTLPLTPGRKHVCAYALHPVAGGTNPLLGCQVAPANPFGSFDGATLGPGAITVRGWAIDPDTASPIKAHVYVDGKFAAALSAARERTDVASVYAAWSSARGFGGAIPVAVGPHVVCVYAINVDTGNSNPLLGCRAVDNTPVGTLDAATLDAGGLRVRGWTIGPDTAGALRVHIYVNGGFVTATTAGVARPDVGELYPDYGASHGYDVTVPRQTGMVCAYAINPAKTGTNPVLGCRGV